MRKKIYIYRIGSLGDSIVALPAIQEIKNIYRDHEFILITEKKEKNALNTWSIFSLANIFDGVLFYKKSIKSIFNLVISIRSGGDSILFYIAPYRPKLSVVRDKFFFRVWCNIKIINGFESLVEPEANKDRNGNLYIQKKEYLQLSNIITSDINDRVLKRPLLNPTVDDIKKANLLLSSLSNCSFIFAIGPGSKMPSKKWPIENYSKIINKILDLDKNFAVIVIGGNEDSLEANLIIESIDSKRLISLAGKTTIGESAAVLSMAKMYIGNDTGTMHLASAMGIKCLGIFASRANPGRWEPFGENNKILRKELYCSGCNLEICNNDNQCLKDITVQEVFNAFLKLHSI